jgi:hypothetical protein
MPILPLAPRPPLSPIPYDDRAAVCGRGAGKGSGSIDEAGLFVAYNIHITMCVQGVCACPRGRRDTM